MSDREKIEAILNLLTDSTWGKLKRNGTLQGEDESFGALVILGHVFSKAYEISRT